MKKLLVTLAIVTFALLSSKLAFGQATTAQPAAKRQWYHIQETVLKPGVANEYYEFRAKERIPALKKAGYKHQEFWIPAAVGTGGAMYVIEPLDDLSGYDQPQNRLTKALGEEGARALGKKTSQYFADGGSHAWLAVSRPEMSWAEQMTAPPKLAIVGRVKVARGRVTDFENYIRNDYLPIVKKSGAVGYSVLGVVYGGDV